VRNDQAKGAISTGLKVALYIAAATLGLLTALAAFMSPAGAWPLCVSALGCLAVANLDRFSELSAGAGGVRVLMRDVERKVAELNRVAALAAKAALALVQRSGRMGGFDDDEKDAFLKEATTLLKDAGHDEPEIAEMLEPNWHKFVRFDYVGGILGQTMVPRNADLYPEWKRLRNFGYEPSPEEVRALLERAGQFDGLRKQLFEEWCFYRERGYHRDPSIWRRREENRNEQL